MNLNIRDMGLREIENEILSMKDSQRVPPAGNEPLEDHSQYWNEEWEKVNRLHEAVHNLLARNIRSESSV